MFLQASVILSTGGVSASGHAGIHPLRANHLPDQTPQTRHPPDQTPRQTPPGADTPWDQTTPPQTQHPPAADTPWD